MSTMTQTRPAARTSAARPITTKIAGKFQVTVPVEVRALFDLQEGDLLEWNFDAETSALMILPKRAQLITPRLKAHVRELQAKRARSAEPVTAG